MEVYCKYVGMDVHKETIAVSVADGTGGGASLPGRNPQHPGSGGQASPATQAGPGSAPVLLRSWALWL